MHIDFNRCFESNNLNFFGMLNALDMVYFLVQLHEKSEYPILPLQCNNLPHENCNNLPQGGNFTRNTCPSKTHAHKAVIIPSIY